MTTRSSMKKMLLKLWLLCGISLMSNIVLALGIWSMPGWVASADPVGGCITLKWEILEDIWKDINWSEPRFAELDATYDFSQKLSFEIRRKRNKDYRPVSYLPEDFFDDAKILGTTTDTAFTDNGFGDEEGFEPVLYQVKGTGKCKGFFNDKTWTVTAVIETRGTICLAYGLDRFSSDPECWTKLKSPPVGHAHARREVEKINSLINGRVYDGYLNLASKAAVASDFATYSDQHPRGGSYADPGDIVFFYLSTHGYQNGLCLYDGEFSKEELADCVRKFKGKGVRFIGIINACHSGSIIEQFKSNEFNYTAWIASCRGESDTQEVSACFSSFSGFQRTFLEWGWEQGLGKLGSVVTFQGEKVSTGAKSDGYLNLYEAAHYADLLFPGASSVREQHFVYVREDMLKKIAIKKAGATLQGTIPARPNKPILSTNESDGTLEIEVAPSPDSNIYAVFATDYDIIEPNDIWGLNPKR